MCIQRRRPRFAKKKMIRIYTICISSTFQQNILNSFGCCIKKNIYYIIMQRKYMLPLNRVKVMHIHTATIGVFQQKNTRIFFEIEKEKNKYHIKIRRGDEKVQFNLLNEKGISPWKHIHTYIYICINYFNYEHKIIFF